jgi:hypothetical protein
MTRYTTLAAAAALSTCALMLLPARAPAAGLAPSLQVSEPGELAVLIHFVPLKGSKGGTWGNHKQCLYGVYGSQGQYKGLHYHDGPYHRGSPCGSAAREPGVIQFGNEPKFRPKPPPRLNPPPRRR